MYKIIGADGKEYGPVSAEQLRQWLNEGRVNTQTRVMPESGGNWSTLSAYPELNPTGGLPPLPPPKISDRASNKIAAGVCGILLGCFGVHKFILGYTSAGLIMLLVSLLSCGFAAPVFGIIGLIEGILYLVKSDEEFVKIYVDGRKTWF
jgi:TM2 domain-containing membrane protein YozV